MQEVKQILFWAERNHSVISAVHILGEENWAADFLSREGLASGEWSLHPEVFLQICHRWGTPDVDLMASKGNAKVPRFVSRYRVPQAIAVDALVLSWNQFHFPYLFPLCSGSAPESNQENQVRESTGCSDRSGLATSDLVCRPGAASRRGSMAAPRSARSSFARADLPPELRGPTFDGLAVESWVLTRAGFSQEVANTMISARQGSAQTSTVFLPKVVSSFHMNEDIVLPSFCLAPTHRVEKALHMLDLVRALRSVSLLAAEAYTHSPVSPNERLGENDFTFNKYRSTGNVLSFSETRAHQVVQQKSEQFMMYNQKQLTRIYPSAYRIDSSNFNPVPYWNSGIQLVALNYQTEGRMMELNRAKFKVNGNCGYVLKPQQMCKGVFSPFSGDPLPASPKKQLILKVISGQQLPKPPDSMLGDRGEIIDPFVEVEIIGLSADCCKEQTRVVDDNGFNPVWEETLTFTVHMPEIALVRFLVWDHDPIGRDFVGQRTVAFSSLMPGYRHVYLEGLTEASIFVHVTINEIYGKNRQFIGLKGFFNRSTKRGSVESNGHIRKRSIGERILRRTASAPAKGRKKTKMVFQESTDSKDFPCEVSGAKEKDVVMRRTSRSLQARPVSMPVDKFFLGAFEPSTSESSKDAKLNDIGNEKSKKNRPVTKERMLENTQNPACLPKHPCLAAATANGRVVHKKWRSLHLDYGKRCDDDIKEFNDTFTSESGDEKEEMKQKSINIEDYKPETSLNSFCQPISAASQERFNVNDLMSITEFSTTVCTEANNLQSTAVILENDISEMINEVPSLNDSDLGSSISALIRRFEFTDEQTSLTCVSSLNGLNSHTKISGYSEIFTPAISTPRKHSSVPKHVDQLINSANNTTIFSSPGTTEYSMYTIIQEENLSGSTLMDANTVKINDRLVDESRISTCKPARPETKPKPAKLVYPEIKPKPTNIRPASMENLLSSSSTDHINCLTNMLPSGPSNKFSTGGPVEFQKASQGLQDVSQTFHSQNIRHRSSHLPYQNNFNNFITSDKLYQNAMLHTNVEQGEVSSSLGIPHRYQRRDQKNSNALKDTIYIAHRGKLHTPHIPKQAGSNMCPTQGTNQPSSCKSKSLGDLTSEDISCNFDSKYKRINRGFLLSGNSEDSPAFVKSKHQSTDTLTEQLRKLVSYDQEDCSKPSLYEEDELEKPRPLTRKLSSRSQSRVRNIANRAKEKQEANKLKQNSPFPGGVVLRNKPPAACPPVNRHSTGSYIAGYSSNFIREGLEGRGIPEGACSSQTYRHNDQFCIDRFTYHTESCNTEEPEVYFLLRL
ncbi:unnamed protein product [Ranitomeya imitator]|uniref:Phosphoinositide phospholipase C n=1 Tax=Ranitomeya imitator TaxID=111125 RepID=A0ABN9L2I4_9NEOB|nr:unnamed protein product [Ranitomeya imitator]